MEQAIKNAAAKQGFGGDLNLKLENSGLVVTLVTDQVLFTPGNGSLAPGPNALLDIVGNSLKAIDNPIEINGYTDSDPIHSAQYPSNDALSLHAPIAVETYFEGLGLDRERLFPSGLGDQRSRRAEHDGREQGPEPAGGDHRPVEGRQRDARSRPASTTSSRSRRSRVR